MLFVTKILGDRETREGDTKASAGRFIHLPIDQGDLGFSQVVLFNDSRLGHLMVEIITLSRALADTGEDRDAAMELGDVINELHNDHCFAHASTAERADFPTLKER